MSDGAMDMAQSAGFIAFSTFIVVALPTRPWWLNMLCWTSACLHAVGLLLIRWSNK